MVRGDDRKTRRLPLALLLGLCCVLPPSAALGQSIFTIGGGGTEDGRPATLAMLSSPVSVAVDSAGVVYLSDRDAARVRAVDTRTGIITTVAGSGIAGFSGDGEAATESSLEEPEGVAVDADGNLFIADSQNNRIRRVDSATGIITTIAGSATAGFTGDGGPATEASLRYPGGVAVDREGNLYISDDYNYRIRRVDRMTGIITTVAGNGQHGVLSGDGGPATEAALGGPTDVAVDDRGNLFIADANNRRVRRVDATTGIITTCAGNGEWNFNGDGIPATQAAVIYPTGVAVDSFGDLYIADDGGYRVRKVDMVTGIITTFAGSGEWWHAGGDDGPATEIPLNGPHKLAFDDADNLYIADNEDQLVRRVDAVTGMMTTIAGGGRQFTGDEGPATEAALAFPERVDVDTEGNLFIADLANHRIRRIDAVTGEMTTVAGNGDGYFSGDGGPATRASLNRPTGVAVDRLGNLFVADRYNWRIRRVDAVTGIITTVAGGGYAEEDGVPATESDLDFPTDVDVDEAGNLFIADRYANRIRRVDGATGIITTYAGGGDSSSTGDGIPATEADLGWPEGIVLDGEGNLYIADSIENVVWRVDGATGIITTYAGNGLYGFSGDGGPATEAMLRMPNDVGLDEAGNLFVADSENVRVRRVGAETGMIATIAGNGKRGFLGDGGPATRASINYPFPGGGGLDVDPGGNLYIADTENHRIRAVFKCVELAGPGLVSPMDRSQGLPTSPSLRWDRVSGAFRYDVYVDVISPPERRVAVDIETTSFSPANLQPLTTYYWRVVAKGDPFCEPFPSAVSEIWSFTTESACDAPVRSERE